MQAYISRGKAATIVFGAALFLTAASAPAQGEPNVVVTIKPLHSIVSAVMQGVGEPTLLIDGGTSPHGFTLRPSQAEALQESDLVVWIGPALESTLDGSIETLAHHATVLAAMEVDGITLHSYDDHAHDEHGYDEHGHDDHATDDHGHDDHGHDDHGHDEHGHDDHAAEEHGHDEHDDHGHAHVGEYDPHIWMDPANAAVIAASTAHALSDIDPANAETYKANVTAFEGELTDITARLTAQLSPHHESPFIVFHDAYRYFRVRFDLENVVPMVVNPEVPPGAHRLEELREEITHEGISCAFAEPQFTPRVLNAITDGLDVTVGTLDPLGADLDAGPGMYLALLQSNADAIVSCLSES